MQRSKPVLALLATLAWALAASQSYAQTPTTLTSLDSTSGADPVGDPTLSADGSALYGMTTEGDPIGQGGLFSTPVAGGTRTTLLSLNGTNGAAPAGDLALIGSILSGMTPHGGANDYGAIFSIPATGGTPTNLLSFNAASGANPQGDSTFIGSTFFGATYAGGVYGDGTVFSLNLVPEPSSLVLLGLGALGLGAMAVRRRMRRRAA